MLFLNPKFKLLGNSGIAGGSVTSWPASPLVIPPAKYLHIEGFIAGYSGGGAIGRLRFGATTTVDTGNNYGTGIVEGATLNTTAVNIPGIPLGVTAITGPRFFTIEVFNVAGIVKRAVGRADASSVSAGTAPLNISVCGIWVNTTSQIGCVDIASYSNLTNTTTGQQFTANTEFAVWGKDEL